MLKLSPPLAASALTLLLAAVSAVRAAQPSAPARPVGQLLNVVGPVQVQRGQQAPKKGALLFPLLQGDVVSVRGAGKAEVVLFGSGARYSLAANSAAVVTRDALQRKAGPVPTVLKRSPIPTVVSQGPRQRILGLVVRGVSPRPNGAMAEGPVVLQWQPNPAAASQELEITDENGKSLHKQTLAADAREYAVPDSLVRNGDYYIWSISARAEGGEPRMQFQAWYRILLPSERAMLGVLQQEAQEAQRSDPDNPAPRLLLAQAYERFGMIQEARSAYQEVQKLRPQDPGIQQMMQRLGGG